jgi:hypothetical protein
MHTIHSRVLRHQNVDRIASSLRSLCHKALATFVEYLEYEHALLDGYSMRIQANMCIASFDWFDVHIASNAIRCTIVVRND